MKIINEINDIVTGYRYVRKNGKIITATYKKPYDTKTRKYRLFK